MLLGHVVRFIGVRRGGARTCSHILGDMCYMGEAYRIYSGIMSHFLYLKIGSKIDFVYTGNAKREGIIQLNKYLYTFLP